MTTTENTIKDSSPEDLKKQIEQVFDNLKDLCDQLDDQLSSNFTEIDPEFSVIISCTRTSENEDQKTHRMGFMFGRRAQIKGTLFDLALQK